MQKGRRTGKQNMVEAEVPDSGEGLAEGHECAEDPDDAADDQVIPIIVCKTKIVDELEELLTISKKKLLTSIYGLCPRDEKGSEQRCKEHDHLPIGRVMSADDLQLRIEVQCKVEQTCPGRRRMTGGH